LAHRCERVLLLKLLSPDIVIPEQRYRQIQIWLNISREAEANQAEHDRNLSLRASGTDQWLLQNEAFLAWYNGSKQPPIIWLNSAPGTGKSILCSYVINQMHTTASSSPFPSSSAPSNGDGSPPAIAFLFHKFDIPLGEVDALRLLAIQLLEVYWLRYHDIPYDLYVKTQVTKEGTTETLKEIITILVKRLKLVCFFFDGIDQERNGWQETVSVMDFVLGLAQATTGGDSAEDPIVRVWYSSRERSAIKKKLEPYSLPLDQAALKADVASYLKNAVSSFEVFGFSSQESEHIFESLQERIEGNFLWASMMVCTLKDEARNSKEVAELIKDRMPTSLHAYYRKIFKQFSLEERRAVRYVDPCQLEHFLIPFQGHILVSSLCQTTIALRRATRGHFRNNRIVKKSGP
jgi:hypothetical protein